MLRRVPAAGAVSALSVRRFDVDLTDLVSFVPIQSSRLLWTFHAGFFALFRTFVCGWPGGGGAATGVGGKGIKFGREVKEGGTGAEPVVRARANEVEHGHRHRNFAD